MWLSSSRANRLVRFCGVGGLVALVDFGLIRVFVLVLAPLVAVGLAYLIAVGLHFCLNRWWVFAATEAPAADQLKRYALVVGACWVCTLGVVAVVLTITSNVFVAKMAAIPPATLLAFVLMRGFVFRVSAKAA
jgi:putative flippase GtrA